MEALRQGQEPRAPEPTAAALAVAMNRDPEVFRGVLDITMCLAHRDQVLARPGFMDKVHAVGTTQPARLPGPDRASLLELLA